MLKFYFCLLFTVVTFTSAQRTPSRFRSGTRSTTTTTPSPDYGDYPDVPTTTHATVHTTTRNSRNQAGNRGIARSANRVAVSGSASASSAHPAAPAFAGAHNEVRQGGPLSLQSQDPYVALDTLRGKSALMADEIQEIMFSARPGVDFPILSTIPDPTSFQCENQKQPGFYADPDFRCQVFRRCDPSGQLFSFLCPNTTIFNQITLTCDYWYNVDCAKSTGFYDFANARLYHENWPLLGGNNKNATKQSVENQNYLQDGADPAKGRPSPQTSTSKTVSGRLTPAPPAELIVTSPSSNSRLAPLGHPAPVPLRSNQAIRAAPSKATAVERTQQQVNEVAGVMRTNLDAILERGDKLGDLDERADHLAMNSECFEHTTNKLKNKYWWKNAKMCICLAISILIIIAIIALIVCYVFGVFGANGSEVKTVGGEPAAADPNKSNKM